MKSLLLLASVLCLALIVTARPTDETSDEKTLTELGEADDTQEEETSESGADTADTGSEDGDLESAHEVDHSDDTLSGEDEETSATHGEDSSEHDAGTEGEAGEGEGAEEDQDGEAGAEEEQSGKEEQGGAEGGEESPRNTYRQVHKLLKNIMKVNMKDKYLKSFVLARLQERLMNPTIDLVGTIEKYSKIKECFNDLAKDVGELVKNSEKSYEECTKDKTNPHCGSEGTRELDDGLIEREQELSDCIVDKRDTE
uniref:Aegyptin/gSG7 salivary protein-like four-helix bundle domain-containing protein n=1 Tax=Anopheles culicifacies TaxID=139723 RepID=A0A182M6N2_9DIPT